MGRRSFHRPTSPCYCEGVRPPPHASGRGLESARASLAIRALVAGLLLTLAAGGCGFEAPALILADAAAPEADATSADATDVDAAEDDAGRPADVGLAADLGVELDAGSAPDSGTAGDAGDEDAQSTGLDASRDAGDDAAIAADAAADGGADAGPDTGPGPGGPGASCDANAPCRADLSCAGGVCCNTACSGDCEACDASGVCRPAADGTACGPSLDCASLVWGLERFAGSILCRAASGEARGACTAGRCAGPDASACTTRGDVIRGCDEACLAANHPCVAGRPSADVTQASLCALRTETTACRGQSCEVWFGQARVRARSCNGLGLCTAETVADCGRYACVADPGGGLVCPSGCRSDADCTSGSECDGGRCVED